MAGAGSETRVVAVTGAAGFIGRALAARLAAEGLRVRAITRETHGDLARADPATLARALEGVDTLMHVAARAHVMREKSPDPAAAFAAANAHATARVARAAAVAGVRQVVLASTVKVNGETTPRGRPFRVGDPPAPADDYARSKWQGELALAEALAGSQSGAVVLRLPLVYGTGMRGNFRTLWEAVAQHRWLPFGRIDNRRSLLGIDNAVDAFVAAMDVKPGTYFVADAESVSTPALVRAIAAAQHLEPRLADVPVGALRAMGLLLGRRDGVARLVSSLEVDASAFAAASGWTPGKTLAQGLAAIISG